MRSAGVVQDAANQDTMTDLQKYNIALNNMANNVGDLAESELYGMDTCKGWGKEIKRFMVIDAFECCDAVNDIDGNFESSNLQKKTKDCYSFILTEK